MAEPAFVTIYQNLVSLFKYRGKPAPAKILARSELIQQLHVYQHTVLKSGNLSIVLTTMPSDDAQRKKELHDLLLPILKDHAATNIIYVVDAGESFAPIKWKKTALETIKELHVEYPGSYIEMHDTCKFMHELPLRPEYVPHRVLTRAERAKISKEIMQPANMLPILSAKDAVAVWLGIRPGDIVEILRLSENAGEAIIYRRCK